MKRGPDHSEKTPECNISPVQVALGIPEIVTNILHHYPRYGLRGQNYLVTVSKVWHEAIKQCHLQEEPTFEKLIADCLKCPESVIQILRDDTLLPYLSEEQILKLISCHSEFAIYLLKNDIISLIYGNYILNPTKLLTLTKHHSEVAITFFTNPKWRQKLLNIHIYKFGCQHLEIAHYILDNNLQDNDIGEIRSNGLKSLAASFVTIARRLLNDPATFRELTEPNLKGPKFLYQYLELLIETARTNESFGFLSSKINTPNDFINQFENLCDLGLTAEEIKVLGEYHSEIAMKVLQSKTLCEKYFDPKSCFQWGKNHETVAMHFLKTEPLCKNLDDDMVVELCKKHPAAVKYVLNTPDLCELVCMAFIYPTKSVVHSLDEIPMHILKDPTLCEMLCEVPLLAFGAYHPRAAKVILTTKDFYTKLSEEKINSICHKHPHILRKILNTQSLREMLEPEHLNKLESIDPQLHIKPLLIKVSEQAKSWDLQTNKPSEEMDIDAVAKFTFKK
ncbi:hypothetical protein [Candidatus Berkiella aquae]|uniref:Uncharacterized protein n=1 Tax=Candidatus Berkiella aquae TaxID=295108 RepID=A0A0Q9YYG7_9GAMM|nr:hypothetical protein [Candidatus Berkiella aquae]MCS5711109.1 hypothetical protein [Candidatus Berkiella aquae]